MSETFQPRNDIEHKLILAQDGRLPPEQFMEDLLTAHLFMPVRDSIGIGGFQGSNRAVPLSLQDEQGTDILVLFTSPERARDFLQDFPGFEGGLLEEFGKILHMMGVGYGVTINPGLEVGMDMEPEMVEQLTGKLSRS